jgi:uncharacterized protein (TIGR03435 family)
MSQFATCRWLVIAAAFITSQTTGASSPQLAGRAARPAFDVASVKPNKSGRIAGGAALLPGGRFTATNVPLRQLVRVAYGLLDPQIAGGPNWVDSDRFDVTAAAGSDAAPAQVRLMLQQLLADRFALTGHRDTRELPIYALAMARNDRRLGPQLRPSQVDCAAAGSLAPQAPQVSPQPGDRLTCDRFDGAAAPRFTAGGVTMAQLAVKLSPLVNRVVADRTGLSGRFDFELQWTPDGLPQRAPGTPSDQPLRVNGHEVDPNGPSIFTALREQLGLALDSRNGPVDVLVIDGASPPDPD